MFKLIRHIALIVCVFSGALTSNIFAQSVVSGRVHTEGQPLPGASALVDCRGQVVGEFTDAQGEFEIRFDCELPILLVVKFLGYETYTQEITTLSGNSLDIQLISTSVGLNDAEVETQSNSDVEWMNSISKGGVYRGIKSSVIRVDKDIIIPGEVQARTIFNKIPGVNMWESDAAGLQIGIGVRGLSPNRSAHLSLRQNGSPIAADPLGYPESYYTPPIEAVSKIEYVSGAGALQYGSQLGGMLNFQLKSGEYNSAENIRVITSATGYTNTQPDFRINSNLFIEHSAGSENTKHYVCYDLKQGEGWRENTEFESSSIITSFTQKVPNSRGELTFNEELTYMSRLERQPGGLTDIFFNNSPRASFRDRNWFRVEWRILRAGAEFKPFNSPWSFNASAFKLDASRQAIGFLGMASRVDHLEERDLISAAFNTGGFDCRATRIWGKEKETFNALVFGLQGYHGITDMQQGLGDATADPNFTYINPNNLEGSDYTMPNTQISGFAQGMFNLSDNLSITPGLRWEYIDTRADGWYRVIIEDLAGNFIEDSVFTPDPKVNKRAFMLPGLGFSYKCSNGAELYGNAVANYRAINFSDIQIQNLGVVVDPDIADERGANFDLGYRKNGEKITWDVSCFMLSYIDKIGVIPTTVPDPVLIEKPIFFRRNLSNARTLGLEWLVRSLLYEDNVSNLSVLVSGSYMKGRYLGGSTAIEGREIENVPAGTFRCALIWLREDTKASIQWNWVGSQYTDATNAVLEPNAVYGEIPSYNILDLSVNHRFSDRVSIGLKLNNALDKMYFTRRATGYPGPGIIPSDGRNIRLSLVIDNL